MEYGARPLRSTRRLSNLAGQRPKWWSITNQASGPTQVSIYDEIGMYGLAAGDFLADMKAVNGDIELHINSPGGDVFDGISIYNQLKQRAGKVHVIVDGLAASAASFIAMAASPGLLEIAPHAEVMIHDGFAMGIGNAADMRTLADQLDRVSDNIASIYAERTGKPAEHWRALMRDETWFSDAEAVAAGLVDRIHGQQAPVNEWDLSVFARFANAVKSPAEQEADDEQPEADNPDPDGDGDDDTSAEGDTDHDYVTPDGKPGPKAKPGPKSALVQQFPVLNAEVDESPWDAAKAWHNGAESDDPAAFYRAICAGRRAGDPSTQDAWALPYKYSPSSPPNAAGVRAALARLSSTQGLTNTDEARSKLERAMKDINPDYEPDDQIDPGLLSALFSLGLEGAGK